MNKWYLVKELLHHIINVYLIWKASVKWFSRMVVPFQIAISSVMSSSSSLCFFFIFLFNLGVGGSVRNAYGILVPPLWISPGPQQWKRGVLSTVPAGTSPSSSLCAFIIAYILYKCFWYGFLKVGFLCEMLRVHLIFVGFSP